MPVRTLEDAISATRTCKKITESEGTVGILDCDGEYDIYEGNNLQAGEAASPMAAENSLDEFARGRQPPSVYEVSPSPVQPLSSSTVERLGRPVTQVEHDIIAATPPVRVTQPVTPPPQQDESIDFPQKVLDLAAEEARLIKTLETTNERVQREKLTAELLQLFERSENMTLSAKAKGSNCVVQTGTFKSDNDTTAATLLDDDDDDQHGGSKLQAEASKITTPSDDSKWVQCQQSHQSGDKTQQPVARKTPPHLRRGVAPWRNNGV